MESCPTARNVLTNRRSGTDGGADVFIEGQPIDLGGGQIDESAGDVLTLVLLAAELGAALGNLTGGRGIVIGPLTRASFDSVVVAGAMARPAHSRSPNLRVSVSSPDWSRRK